MKHVIAILSFLTLTSISNLYAQNETVASSQTRILNTYFEVKNALVAGNSNLVALKCKELETDINTLPIEKMGNDEKDLWLTYEKEIESNIKHMYETNDIAIQRKNFIDLSEGMYKIVKSLKTNSNTVYQQYCPMKKAAWLSEVPDIKNPYYGKQMLTCGKTIEKIAPRSK